MQTKQQFLPIVGVRPVLHSIVGFASSTPAESLSIPKSAPKSAVAVDSKGTGYPHPEAERLARFNRGYLVDNDCEGMRAHDLSGAFYKGAISATNPRLTQLKNRLEQNLAPCQGFGSKLLLLVVVLSSDLHNFVVLLRALQIMLALRGRLFLPWGTDNWHRLTMSSCFDADAASRDIELKHVRKKAQNFYRITPFMTTATPEEIRYTMVNLAAERGYEELIWPKNAGLHVVPVETMILHRKATPNVTNVGYIINDRNKYPNSKWCISKIGVEKYLPKVNSGHFASENSHENICAGFIIQISNLPLGEKTEYFTNAHVDDRLARKRNMTPGQIAEERKEIEERTFREAAKKAPYFQELMTKVAQKNTKAAQSSIQVRDSALPEFQRDLHRLAQGLGLSGEWIELFINKARSDLVSAVQFACYATDYAQRRLQSIREWVMKSDTYYKFGTEAEQAQMQQAMRRAQKALYQQISQGYSRGFAVLWRRNDNLDGLTNLFSSFLTGRLVDLDSTDRAQVLALNAMD